MKAALYARRSNDQTERDEDAKSVTRQVERAREFAAKKGWTVDDAHVFVDDAITGAEWEKRPGWAALKRAAGVGDKNATPAFNVLIVMNQSRIGRDAQRVPFEIVQVEDADVEIWSYQDKRRITVTDESGEIEVAIRGIADSFYRRSASKNALEELQRRARNGSVAGGKIYGYENHRPHKGAQVQRRVDPAQAKTIVKIFELVADGWGYGRIARYLNELKIAGPKTLGAKTLAEMAERGEEPETPTWSLSGVREIVRRHRLYAYGEYTWGASRRSRKRGSKVRLKRDAGDDTIVKLVKPEWVIVDPELAERALKRIADYNATILRSGVGDGKERTRFVAKPEQRGAYLLSGMLRCGARLRDGTVCSAPMTVGARGRRALKYYSCSAYKEKKTCTTAGAVRMDTLNEAVIRSLRSTFTEEAFEEYLQGQAQDVVKIAEQQALRARLIDEELPAVIARVTRLTKRLAQIDDDDVAAVVQSELKEAVAERKQTEAKIAALDAYVAGLKDQAAQVEKLREAWGNWAGALDSGTLRRRARRRLQRDVLPAEHQPRPALRLVLSGGRHHAAAPATGRLRGRVRGRRRPGHRPVRRAAPDLGRQAAAPRLV